jgi:hypothetical protein
MFVSYVRSDTDSSYQEKKRVEPEMIKQEEKKVGAYVLIQRELEGNQENHACAG